MTGPTTCPPAPRRSPCRWSSPAPSARARTATGRPARAERGGAPPAPARAPAPSLPVVVSGTVGKVEDVDWYAVTVEAGRRVTFSLWGNRLEDKIHDLQAHMDPILGLHDAAGRELAVDDNAQFADPRLSYEFPEAGTYYLQVRDTTYAGNPNWTYVLQVTSGP